MFSPAILFSLILVSFSGCGDKSDPLSSGSGNGDDEMTVTYTEHVKPILEQSCTSCHAADREGAGRNGAPLNVNLDTYENTVESGLRANVRIQAGTMPPGTGGIPAEERALFQSWIDQGMPE